MRDADAARAAAEARVARLTSAMRDAKGGDAVRELVKREMGVEAQLARGSAPIRRNVARPRMRPWPSAIGKDEKRLVRT